LCITSVTSFQYDSKSASATKALSQCTIDITLMICLLRNLIPIAIIDGLPSVTDQSLRADLSRIKFYRNFIVHCDSAGIIMPSGS
jgi:hypothetical protein